MTQQVLCKRAYFFFCLLRIAIYTRSHSQGHSSTIFTDMMFSVSDGQVSMKLLVAIVQMACQATALRHAEDCYTCSLVFQNLVIEAICFLSYVLCHSTQSIFSAGYQNNLHVLNVSTMLWTDLVQNGDIPPPRQSFSMAVVGGSLYVFGGRNSAGE